MGHFAERLFLLSIPVRAYSSLQKKKKPFALAETALLYMYSLIVVLFLLLLFLLYRYTQIGVEKV